MSAWGNLNKANNAPTYAVAAGYGVNVNGQVLFANTTPSAWVNGAELGVFAATTTNVATKNTASEGNKVAHQGWQLRKEGTGPILSIAINNPGINIGGANTGFLVISGDGTGANATYSLNANGGMVSVTLNSGGTNWANVANTKVITPSATFQANTTNATYSIVLGGRAGRVQYETLVAMKVT